jgi:hypothetical protein
MKVVIPTQAGIQKDGLDTGLRRYDGRTFMGKPESSLFEPFWTPAFAGERMGDNINLPQSTVLGLAHRHTGTITIV